MRLREGDKVKVIAGKDAGKESRVVRVMPRDGRVIVTLEDGRVLAFGR